MTLVNPRIASLLDTKLSGTLSYLGYLQRLVSPAAIWRILALSMPSLGLLEVQATWCYSASFFDTSKGRFKKLQPFAPEPETSDNWQADEP